MKSIVVENGIITPTNDVAEFVGVEVYEVLRLMEGIPLFWEAHFDRFRSSLMALDVVVPREPLFWADIKLLSTATGVRNCNVRFSVQIQNGAVDTRRVQFLEAVYPDEKAYAEGVVVGTLEAERPNPNLKINNPDLRDDANVLMAKNNWYEVLLIDRYKKITEGSRSNVFFVKGDRIYTPPASLVLSGITRKKVVAMAESLSLKCYERDIMLFQLEHMDAMCLTGTSPKILPVKSCAGVNFDVTNSIVQYLIKAYDNEIKTYLANRR